MQFNKSIARIAFLLSTTIIAVNALAADQTAPPGQAGKSVFMCAEWTALACDGWNRDPVLTDRLVESGWIDHDGKRGFKGMQIYRLDCPASTDRSSCPK